VARPAVMQASLLHGAVSDGVDGLYVVQYFMDTMQQSQVSLWGAGSSTRPDNSKPDQHLGKVVLAGMQIICC
jgi:hypothetical protein